MKNNEHWTIGIHAVTALLQKRPADIVRIQLQLERKDTRLGAIRTLCKNAGITTEETSRQDMDKQHPGVHQGVAALHRSAKPLTSERDLTSWLSTLNHDPLLLVLDGITDPHNLGACLRTADAAGVDAVIIPKDKSAPLNTTVRKAASGATESITIIQVTNLARCLEALKKQGIWLAGTEDNAETTLYEQNLTGPLALIMGSEDTGLRRLTRSHCDYLISIPLTGTVTSLNVSVATGVCLFEASRQRQKATTSQ
ncbi:MAG: 23S rRNA (guanosine(2251)-2'-O)-methyltransferase RlmB [Pseudohongiellaceae bacterium]